MNNNDKKIIDVDYTDEDIRIITDELDKSKIYYTTGQVAKILGLTDSKLRYWTNFFALDSNGNDMIKVEYTNKNRSYTSNNIEKLKYMKKLIEDDGMTLQQAKDYTTINGFNANTKELQTDNPLALQAFISGLTQEMENKLANFENRVIEKVVLAMEEKNKELILQQKEVNQVLKQEIVITVDQALTDNLKGKFENLSESIENRIQEFSKEQSSKLDEILSMQREDVKHELEICDNLKRLMQERKEEANSNKISWFKKYLNKFN